MDHTIYFADKVVIFTTQSICDASYILHLASGEQISRAKILKILETHNSVAVVSSDPDAVFDLFSSEFAAVDAAGGVVINRRGEWLMIHRNGRWDLPKGHVELYETFEQCAVREIGEETGVCDSRVVRHLCDTIHCYNLYGKWELKHTHWFELRIDEPATTEPQQEEGIDRAVWCSVEQVTHNLVDTFPTIRRVAECMRG